MALFVYCLCPMNVLLNVRMPLFLLCVLFCVSTGIPNVNLPFGVTTDSEGTKGTSIKVPFVISFIFGLYEDLRATTVVVDV